MIDEMNTEAVETTGQEKATHLGESNSTDLLCCTLKDLENWLDSECYKCGAVDGYDYNSGVEYGLRLAALEVKKRREAI